MLDALKQLIENNVISEEIKGSIEEAWNQKVQENRESTTQQLREEFAQKYAHDREVMVEAIDQMITDRLTTEIKEFTEDRHQLAEAKAKYAVAIREHSNKLNSFVADKLSSEIHDLHEDQKVMASNFTKLEEFIIESLAKEITDFYQDKKDLAETKVKLVKEAKVQFGHLKNRFVKQSAELVEGIVKQSLTNELHQLREDIDAARQNDFGRRIFEAFNTEYKHSLLNEKSETSKLLKVIQAKDLKLAEAKSLLNKKQMLIESAQKEVSRTKALVERKEVMNELLAPLNTDQKEIMKELLESIQTEKLRTSFERYLPSVVKSNGSQVEKKRPLVESKEVTGNKQPSISSASSTAEVFDIRRLAGLQ